MFYIYPLLCDKYIRDISFRSLALTSDDKENVNNADWRELKSYTSHGVRIFLTVDLSGTVLSLSVSMQK